MTNAPRWDLDSILPGGLEGEVYRRTVAALEAEVGALVERADALPALPGGLAEYVVVMSALHGIVDRISQVSIYTHCHVCADTQDRRAQRLSARTRELWDRYQRAWVPLNDQIAHASAEAFQALHDLPEVEPMRPSLARIRDRQPLLLPRAQEALITDLGRDGIHSWGRFYDRLSGRLQVELSDVEGPVSVARAKNRLSHGDGAVRRAALAGLEAAWTTVEDDCAAALTHIVGTRQVLNDRRGVDELSDSLFSNRMSRESLEAMLAAARRAGPVLERYLAVKARLLGQAQVGFADLSAPVGTLGEMSWDSAQQFVEDHFASYSGDLAGLARRAFAERWVEAEDRDHKRQGAWCGRVGTQPGVSRVFMTFGETFRSTTTLAHELGHAYHNWVLRDAHPARRAVPSTLAETASIFAENIIRDAALAAAVDAGSRVAMLDARLAAGVSFLMNIPFRYHLERDLYTLRRDGDLDPDDLTARCLHWQRDCYRDTLSDYYPHFWAEKLHFYMSGRSFYNYPYTFGYMFSSLVYQRARAAGPSYRPRYVALLERTGWQHAEPLSAELLGVDLTDPDHWYEAVAPLEDDLAAFEADAEALLSAGA